MSTGELTLDDLPFVTQGDWTQERARVAKEAFETLPKRDQQRVTKMIEATTAPAVESVRIIKSFARAEPDDRERVYGMFRSDDERERSLALTTLSECAPEPDPRSVQLGMMAKDLRRMAARFPDDKFNARILKAADSLVAIERAIDAAHTKRVKEMAATPRGDAAGEAPAEVAS